MPNASRDTFFFNNSHICRQPMFDAALLTHDACRFT